MRRSHALLVALFCALSFSARAQSVVIFEPTTNHDWIIRYGSSQYGLQQVSYIWGPEGYYPQSTLYFGSHNHTFHTTVWPILAAFVAVLLPIAWLITYGIGSFSKPAKKHPPPNPSPPP